MLLHSSSDPERVDVNDPARAVDRLEEWRELAPGLEALAAPELPRAPELIEHVLTSLDWRASAMRVYRTRIDYPLYGSQVVLAFGAQE